MKSYDALAEVYEWLISDANRTPAEFAESFDDVLALLPSNAHVLDCSCGTGQLAVGLAGLGIRVVATDASESMVRRTAELSAECGAPLRALRADWQELPDHFDDDTFDMVYPATGTLRHVGSRSTTSRSRSRKLAWLGRFSSAPNCSRAGPTDPVQLEVELDRVGLRIEMSTFDPEAENYRVVASKV